MSSWTQVGDPRQQWTFGSQGASARQTFNGNPMFLLNEAELINVKIYGSLEVNDVAYNASFVDNDFIGFVFGYESSNTPAAADSQRYYLVDWSGGGGGAPIQGIYLNKVDTLIPSNFQNNFPYHPLYWYHNSFPGFEVLQTGGSPWQQAVQYDFELTYTTTEIVIRINGGVFNNDTLIHQQGCFKPGKFGFYNFSQSNCTYSNFRYEHIANFSLNQNEGCRESYFEFSADGCATSNYYDNSAFNLTWDFDGKDSISNTANFKRNFNTPGKHQIRLFIKDNNGCRDTIQQEVMVFDAPKLELGNDITLCSGKDTTLEVITNGNSLLWNTGETSSKITARTNQQYWATLSNQMGCKSLDTISIHEAPNFDVQLAPNDTICSGNTITLAPKIIGYSENLAYQWNTGYRSPTLQVNEEGYYQLVVNDQYGCKDSASQFLKVIQAAAIELGPDQNICESDSVVLKTNTLSSNLVWNTGENTPQITLYNLEPKEHRFWVSNSSPHSCGASDTITVNVFEMPEIDLAPHYHFCSMDSLLITLNDTSAHYSFLWSDFSTNTTFTTASEQKVWVKVTNGACINSDTTFVEKITIPNTNWPRDTIICLDGFENKFQLNAQQHEEDRFDYEWSTGAIENSITISREGIYSVEISRHNCSLKDTIRIINSCYGSLYVPNAFSPNNDGLNDNFQAKGEHVLHYDLWIYNRWGNLLFHSNDIENGWDGMLNNKEEAPIGVYTYKLNYTLSMGNASQKSYSKHGSITLVR